MKFKKIAFGTGTVIAVSVPIVLSLGCSTNSVSPYVSKDFRASLENHNFEHKNGDYYNITSLPKSMVFDATIKNWIDGDTVRIDNIVSTEDKSIHEIKGKSSWNIRIENIDTPELHVEDDKTGKIDKLTTGKEFKYADEARKFGNNEMPVGTHIKLITSQAQSYTRIVGNLFYDPNDDNKYKNYGVELIKVGLTLPFKDDATKLIIGDSGLMPMLAKDLADGYNQAIKSRMGMFSENIHDILGVHGVADDTIWRWREDPRGDDDPANVYDALNAAGL